MTNQERVKEAQSKLSSEDFEAERDVWFSARIKAIILDYEERLKEISPQIEKVEK